MRVLLSLGGNKEGTLKSFDDSIIKIKEEIGEVIKESSVYYTEAWGFELETAPFYNKVIELNTSLTPQKILIATQGIEKQIGRKSKTVKEYQSRIIDIDILFCENIVFKDDKLTIPHYLIHKRNFILTPLVEISPNFIHPSFQKTIKELLLQSKDDLLVKKLEN